MRLGFKYTKKNGVIPSILKRHHFTCSIILLLEQVKSKQKISFLSLSLKYKPL